MFWFCSLGRMRTKPSRIHEEPGLSTSENGGRRDASESAKASRRTVSTTRCDSGFNDTETGQRQGEDRKPYDATISRKETFSAHRPSAEDSTTARPTWHTPRPSSGVSTRWACCLATRVRCRDHVRPFHYAPCPVSVKVCAPTAGGCPHAVDASALADCIGHDPCVPCL